DLVGTPYRLLRDEFVRCGFRLSRGVCLQRALPKGSQVAGLLQAGVELGSLFLKRRRPAADRAFDRPGPGFHIVQFLKRRAARKNGLYLARTLLDLPLNIAEPRNDPE